jgi:effector-binding domain-containing protein
MRKKYVIITVVFTLVTIGLLYYLLDLTTYSVKGRINVESPVDYTYELIQNQKNAKNWIPYKILSIKEIGSEPYYYVKQEIKYQNKKKEKYHWEFLPHHNGTSIHLKIEGDSYKFKFLNNNFMNDKREKFFELKKNLINYINDKLNETKLTIDKDPIYFGETNFIYLKSKTLKSEKNKIKDSLFRKLFGKLFKQKKQKLLTGKPFVIYDSLDTISSYIFFKVGVPTNALQINNFKIEKREGGKYLKAIHQGKYKFLSDAWKIFIDSINQSKYKIDTTRKRFEIYTKGKSKELTPSKWETELYIPIE